MIGRQPDGGIVYVHDTPSSNTLATTFVPANTWPTVDARPLWDTTPLGSASWKVRPSASPYPGKDSSPIMIGRQPDGSTVNVEPQVNYVRVGNTPLPNIGTVTVAATTDARPLWDTTPAPTTKPTLEDYQEACRKIRALSNKHVGPWSTWKTILELLPKE